MFLTFYFNFWSFKCYALFNGENLDNNEKLEFSIETLLFSNLKQRFLKKKIEADNGISW